MVVGVGVFTLFLPAGGEARARDPHAQSSFRLPVPALFVLHLHPLTHHVPPTASAGAAL